MIIDMNDTARRLERENECNFNADWWYQRQYSAGQLRPLLIQEKAKGIDQGDEN